MWKVFPKGSFTTICGVTDGKEITGDVAENQKYICIWSIVTRCRYADIVVYCISSTQPSLGTVEGEGRYSPYHTAGDVKLPLQPVPVITAPVVLPATTLLHAKYSAAAQRPLVGTVDAVGIQQHKHSGKVFQGRFMLCSQRCSPIANSGLPKLL